jgi:hypothetical protein
MYFHLGWKVFNKAVAACTALPLVFKFGNSKAPHERGDWKERGAQLHNLWGISTK